MSRSIGLVQRFFLCAFATVTLMLVACERRDESTRIILAESTISNQVGLTHIAREKGFWAAEGLDVQISSFAAGRQALDAVLGGAAQFGTVAQTPLALAAFSNADFQVIAEIANVSTELNVVARRSSGIRTPLDLRGKRVAFSAGTQSDYFLTLFLTSNGMSRGDVTGVSMAPPDSVSALANRTVDAIVVWRPHSTNAVSTLGTDAVVLPTDRLYTAVMGMITTREYADSNPQVVAALLRGLIRAERFARENRAEAIEIVARNVQLPPQELATYFDDYQFSVKLTDVMLDALRAQGQWAIDSGITKQGSTLPDYRRHLQVHALRDIDRARATLRASD